MTGKLLFSEKTKSPLPGKRLLFDWELTGWCNPCCSWMKVRNYHSQCVRNVLRNLNLIWSPRLHRQETNQDFDALQTKYTEANRCQAIAKRKTPTNRGFQKSSKKLFFTIERPDFLICKQAQLLSVCVCARQLSIAWTKLGLRNLGVKKTCIDKKVYQNRL